jgi:ABC-type nitrate/sulfonate/bicarbonate transport system permease component
VWAVVASAGVFPGSLFPHPLAVARGLVAEIASGRVLDDAVASLFRV